VSTADAGRPGNWFVRAAAVIGDLSNPFYREERQRDVWNEASAVALQVLLWLNLLAATAVIWIVGADALPYVYGMLIMVGLAGWIAILYSWSLGVDVQDSTWVSWSRVVPLAVLAVLAGALAIGMVRASGGGASVGDLGADDWSTVAGMVTGAGVVLALAALGARLARRWTRSRGED
jgi:hypothetical protein